MPDIKWIKITTEMFDDEKIRVIEAMPEADTLIVIWIRLICMAGKVNAGGHIYLAPDLPYDDEQLAAVFNRPLNTVRLALATFVRLKMIECADDGNILLLNFSKHQSIVGMEEVKEQARIRQERFRQREKRKLLAAPETEDSRHVTLRNVISNGQIRIDTSIEEKNSIDVITIWSNILLLLEKQINKANFNLWLKDTVGMEQSDTELVIGVQREDQARHLEKNLKSLIQKCILEETGRALKLRIVLIDN